MFKEKSTYFLLGFIAILFLFVRYFFDFDGLYGQDSYEYLRYSDAIKTFFVTGKPPGDYFWGVYYPALGSILSFIIPNSALSLQLISLISLLITTRFIEKIILLLYKDNSFQNIPFLFYTLSPIVLIHSFLIMSDMVTCCFITIAFFYLLHYLETLQNKSVLIGVLFCILALMTRYASGVLFFPISCMVFIQLIKTKNYKVFAISILIAVFVLIPHLLIRTQNSLQFLSHQWLITWDILNLFRNNFETIDGESHFHFINLIYIFFQLLHPTYLFIGIIIIVFFFKNGKMQMYKTQRLILFSIAIYAIFLGGIAFQNKRFLLLSFPLVVVSLYPTIKMLFTAIRHPKHIFVCIFMIQIILGFYFFQPFYDRNKLEKSICKEMIKHEGKILYVFDIDMAMQGRKLQFDYRNLFLKRYSNFEKKALVLINEKQLVKQWKGKNPLLNWNSIQKKCRLIKLKTVAADWNLYEIQLVKKI